VTVHGTSRGSLGGTERQTRRWWSYGIPGGRLGIGLTAIAIAVLVAYWILLPVPPTSDAENYWVLDLADPYRNRWAEAHSFVYSPVVAQLVYPFTLLPFDVFYRLLLAANLVCLVFLLGPIFAALALILPFVQSELVTGQIHLPLAVMCVLLFAWPATWAFGTLTKVTPSVTILWFIARREWRAVGIATGVTAAIVAVSVATAPQLWADWIDLLVESSTRSVQNFTVNEWPVIYRLPIAAGLMVMAAWRGRRAAVPVLVCFSLPAIWVGSLVMLAAIPRLIDPDETGIGDDEPAGSLRQ
jgi:Glycosyltransferase family 87